MSWSKHVESMEDTRSADRYLVGRPEGRRQFGRPKRKWKDNIKMEAWTELIYLRIGTSSERLCMW